MDFILKPLLNFLHYCFCFMLQFFTHKAWGVLAPQPGIRPAALAWESSLSHWTTRKSHKNNFNNLRPHGLQQARLPCSSPAPRICSNSCPWSQWCHPTISSSIIPFSSCLQSFPASGSFPRYISAQISKYIGDINTLLHMYIKNKL